MTSVKIDNFEETRAIQLPGGEVLDIPARTAAIYENLVAAERSREDKSEYDHHKSVLEILFGEDGFKKIAPDGKETNLDFIAKVSAVAQELFLADKIEAMKAEEEKKRERLSLVADYLTQIAPLADKIK